MMFGGCPQILRSYASQSTPSHRRHRFHRPQLHSRRTGSCQYCQYQLDVSNFTSFVTASLIDFASVGIVIIAMISLFVSDCISLCFLFLIASMDRCPSVGSRFSAGKYWHHHCRNGLTVFLALFRYANCAWVPVLVVFIVAAAVNGKTFVNVETEPASMVQIFNFGATTAGFTITWSTLSSDYTSYFHPDVPRFVGLHGSLHHSLISTQIVGEFTCTHTSASPFL